MGFIHSDPITDLVFFLCFTPMAGQYVLMYTPNWGGFFSITPIAKVPQQAHTQFFSFSVSHSH